MENSTILEEFSGPLAGLPARYTNFGRIVALGKLGIRRSARRSDFVNQSIKADPGLLGHFPSNQ
jgi:hypothetical protein